MNDARPLACRLRRGTGTQRLPRALKRAKRLFVLRQDAQLAPRDLNVTFAKKACASLKRSRETIDAILSDVPPSRVHRVYYEDLLDERANGTWAAVLDYLGVQIAPLRTTLVRVRNASAPRFLDEDLAEATLRDAGCASHL